MRTLPPLGSEVEEEGQREMDMASARVPPFNSLLKELVRYAQQQD
jgi:hypothetical protein